MGLFRGDWINYAKRLWERETVEKLDEHVRVVDGEPPVLLDPVPDPHPQYFHLINDTAWAGLYLDTDTVLQPGDTLTGYDGRAYPDWQLISDPVAGTITVPVGEGGGYQFNLYFSIQAASNGGTYIFDVLVDGQDVGLSTVIAFSNQNDLGSATIVGFWPVDTGAGAPVLTFRMNALSTQAVTVLDLNWTMVRLFPPAGEVDDPNEQLRGVTAMHTAENLSGMEPVNWPSGGPPGPP